MNKTAAERLLAGYDADPIAALTVALRVVLDLGDASWTQLLNAAPIDDRRRQLLQSGDQCALDDVAAELNERRRLGA